MKLLVGVACAAVILVAGVFLWDRYQGQQAEAASQSAEFDQACADAYAAVGRGGNFEQARRALDICEAQGWKR